MRYFNVQELIETIHEITIRCLKPIVDAPPPVTLGIVVSFKFIDRRGLGGTKHRTGTDAPAFNNHPFNGPIDTAATHTFVPSLIKHGNLGRTAICQHVYCLE